jgi:transcriptional regulator with XRE-family HTH domain
MVSIGKMKRYSLEEFGNRIKKIRKALKLSQNEFARGINMSGSFISDLESGSSRAGYDFFYALATVYDVNLYYLVLGEGEMFGREETRPSLGKKEFGNRIETANELLWYVEQSPLFKMTMLGFATKYLYDNNSIIKKDIDMKKKEGGTP